jgi:predicted RNase H-like nuclease (RuvC/YqgF family)
MSEEQTLAEQIKAAVDEATSGLAKKNGELLAELKEARKGKQIDPAELDKLQNKIDELENNLTASQKTIKEQQKAFEQTKAALDSESGFTSKLLLDNGLTDALVKAGVATPFLPAVKAMLSSQAKIAIDGDIRKAVIGDKDLSAFVTEWATSDDGKHYIAAPHNNGGGASGGSNSTGQQVVNRSTFDNMSHPERASFAKSGGKVTD